MFSRSNRRLTGAAAIAVLTLAGLAPTLSSPAYAGTTHSATPASESPATATEVVALSVPETRQAVANVLAANGAAAAWPAVDANLTPQLEAAVATNGGAALSSVFAFPFKIKIHCEITFPPLQIKCTIQIEFSTSTRSEVTTSSVPETQAAVSDVLAANGASEAWPAVNADLTPKLNEAVARGGGIVLSDIFGLDIKVTIHCEITFPPLRIKCTITITF